MIGSGRAALRAPRRGEAPPAGRGGSPEHRETSAAGFQARGRSVAHTGSVRPRPSDAGRVASCCTSRLLSAPRQLWALACPLTWAPWPRGPATFVPLPSSPHKRPWHPAPGEKAQEQVPFPLSVVRPVPGRLQSPPRWTEDVPSAHRPRRAARPRPPAGGARALQPPRRERVLLRPSGLCCSPQGHWQRAWPELLPTRATGLQGGDDTPEPLIAPEPAWLPGPQSSRLTLTPAESSPVGPHHQQAGCVDASACTCPGPDVGRCGLPHRFSREEHLPGLQPLPPRVLQRKRMLLWLLKHRTAFRTGFQQPPPKARRRVPSRGATRVRSSPRRPLCLQTRVVT